MSATGVRHGDPLAAVCFSLGYAVALRAVRATYPSVLLPSYIDDTNLLARVNVATPAGLLLQQECTGVPQANVGGGPN